MSSPADAAIAVDGSISSDAPPPAIADAATTIATAPMTTCHLVASRRYPAQIRRTSSRVTHARAEVGAAPRSDHPQDGVWRHDVGLADPAIVVLDELIGS
jgi:hypothetical protein